MSYINIFIISFLISFIFTPIFRIIALKFSILDYPNSDLKSHQKPIPYLGGLSIALGFFISLFIIRLTTHFPSGTLRSLRGIFFGSIIVLIIGFIDDLKYKGVHFTTKFLAEIIAALIVIYFGIKIDFISPQWFSVFITLIWIVGITNSINLIDIMDGLAAGVSFIASLSFFIVTQYIKSSIYVSYASIVLCGAILGFLPYNLSRRHKIFMGDMGSLFIGFVLSNISLAVDYSFNNYLAVLTPIIFLLIPIYETFFISFLRIKKGQLPFIGSKDHFAIRLENLGFKRIKILFYTYLFGLLLLFLGLVIVLSNTPFITIFLILLLLILIIILTKYLLRVNL